MGNTLQVGETYKSPKYARYIEVLAIADQANGQYTLDILWVDSTTDETTPDNLVVSQDDINSWTLVEF